MKHLMSENRRVARQRWQAELSRTCLKSLDSLSQQYRFSIALGDLLLLNGTWYVTLAGLLRLAARNHCFGITVHPVSRFCDPAASRWVFKAKVYKTPRSKGFVGYGDADPSNVSPIVRGAEMRVSESRATARALRKAFGIPLCAVEELGSLSSREKPPAGTGAVQPRWNANHSGNGHPRLRDRLCLLIRHHQLDPTLVKRYASHFCGTQELREASRDLVESFVTHLGEWAAKDRPGLLCKLNSYAQPEAVQP